MKQKNVFISCATIILFFLTVIPSHAITLKKFDPTGTWEYSAPDVAEGYTTGELVIVEKEDGYGVTMVLFETNRLEATKVEYDNKLLSCTLYVDDEKVTISGTFKKDTFTGTATYSEGVFDFTAVRMNKP